MAIRVLSSDRSLRSGLLQQLAIRDRHDIYEFDPLQSDGVGDTVLAPVSSCPVELCRCLVRHGYKVVLLAPVPRKPEAEAYGRAGATAYLAMTFDFSELVNSVLSIAGAETTRHV